MEQKERFYIEDPETGMYLATWLTQEQISEKARLHKEKPELTSWELYTAVRLMHQEEGSQENP